MKLTFYIVQGALSRVSFERSCGLERVARKYLSKSELARKVLKEAHTHTAAAHVFRHDWTSRGRASAWRFARQLYSIDPVFAACTGVDGESPETIDALANREHVFLKKAANLEREAHWYAEG